MSGVIGFLLSAPLHTHRPSLRLCLRVKPQRALGSSFASKRNYLYITAVLAVIYSRLGKSKVFNIKDTRSKSHIRLSGSLLRIQLFIVSKTAVS